MRGDHGIGEHWVGEDWIGEDWIGEGLDGGLPPTKGRRSWMPLYLTTFLLVVVALERLIDHALT